MSLRESWCIIIRFLNKVTDSLIRVFFYSVDTLTGKQHPARGNWNITPHPVVGDEGPGEEITAPSFGGS